MLNLSWIDPRQTVHLESGYGLDAIGAMKGIDLPRNNTEPDALYRNRLTIRLWEWRGPTSGDETTAPADDSKPRENHIRDAINASNGWRD